MNDLPLRWEWDDAKDRENLRKHGLNFAEAMLVFDDPLSATRPDPYPFEERWRTMGEIGGAIIIVVHTRPEADYERRESVGRIISARPAQRRERDAYAEGGF